MNDAARDRFRVPLEAISYLGHDLSRPECIVAEADGTLWISDDRGGVTRLDPAGTQTVVGRIAGTPNGLAMEASGSLLIADISTGAIHRLFRDGRHQTVFDAIGEEPLGAVNFVFIDMEGTLWITVSTRMQPRSEAIKRPIPDGYVLRVCARECRVVASQLCFPNELRIDTEARHVYVAESARGRVLRMELLPDGNLGPPETFGPDPLFETAIVDGIAFDSAGAIWVTEVTRNGVHRILPNGESHCVLEDPTGGTVLFPASVTFAGPDLRTVLLGSIRATRLATFRSPVAGVPLSHWRPAVGLT